MFVLYENDSQLLVIIFFNILGNTASLQVQNFCLEPLPVFTF